jgi:L-ascorbate metabolism protein UlaG (beta-lactamase superfamily)
MQLRTTFHLIVCALAVAALPAAAQNVKITPLGSHAGELCDRDRATIFEDPTGVRLLYDVGHTLSGSDDPRLGTIHAVLLSHAHGDHIGDRKLKAVGAGTCAQVETIDAGANSMTAEVAAAKNAAIVMSVDMSTFVAQKIQNITGKPTPICVVTGGAVNVPVAATCRSNVHLGGTFTARAAGAKQGVEITVVYASHANNVAPTLVSEPSRSQLAADGFSLTLGPPTGFVVKFTNGLTVFLSGDTGIHTEMKTVVNDFHKANLAVMNLGPNAINAVSAAYAVNELVQPASVIASHVNEAATQGGKLRPESRTAAFIARLKGRAAHLAVSGRTMEFDGKGKCVSACQ